MVRRIRIICKVTRTNEGKDDREEHEAMKKSKHHDKEEHLEEHHEGVVVGGGKKDHGQESREAAVEHCRSNLKQRVLNPKQVR